MNRQWINRWALGGVLALVVPAVYGQNTMFIGGLSATSADINADISILGAGFPSQSNLKVFFGSIEATVASSSATLIRVQVPASAQKGNVLVLDTSTKGVAYSPEVFMPSFGGGDLATSSSVFELEASNTEAMYDLCVCDFNADGKLDVATSQRGQSTLIPIFLNTNSAVAGAANFSANASDVVTPNQPTVNVTCGDLDGDGVADLVATQDRQGETAGNDIYVIKNGGSALSSTPTQTLELPNQGDGSVRLVRRVVIRDIDQDGKPDLVVNNELDDVLFVFLNTSAGSTLSFNATPVSASATPADDTTPLPSLIGLDVQDIDGDLVPDVIASSSESPNKVVFLRNRSRAGNVIFENARVIGQSGSGSFVNLAVADLNKDQKNDVALTSRSGNKVSVFINQSNATSIGFADEQVVSLSGGEPWGIDIGDVNGDGFADIVTTDIKENEGKIHVLINSGSQTALTFTDVPIDQARNRNVKLADVNQDGRQDILLVSGIGGDNHFYVVQNTTCVAALPLSPEKTVVCVSPTVNYSTIKLPGLSYTWTIGGTGAPSPTTGASESFDFPSAQAAGSYTLQVTAQYSDGTCSSIASKTLNITKQAGSPPAATLAPGTANQEVCEGGGFIITPNVSGTTTSFHWTWPDGSQTTERSLSLSQATSEHAGKYFFYYTDDDGCASDNLELNVSILRVPVPVIRVIDDAPYGCTGGSGAFNEAKVLEAAHYPGYAYQWVKGNTNIGGATQSRYSATRADNYLIRLSIPGKNDCIRNSNILQIQAIDPPSPRFESSHSVICQNKSITFTATSVVANNAEPFDVKLAYAWDFGDNSALSKDEVVQKSYANAQEYDIELSTGYVGIRGCERLTTQKIIVIAPPTIQITATPNVTEKCPIDNVILSAPAQITSGDFTLDAAGYAWSNGRNQRAITVKEKGTYSVTVTDVALCESTAEHSLSYKSSSPVRLSAKGQVSEDKLTLALAEDEEVDIGIENGKLLSFLPTTGIMQTGDKSFRLTAHYDNNRTPPYTYQIYVLDNAECINEPELAFTLSSQDKTPKGFPLFTPNGQAPFNQWNLYKLEFNNGLCDLRIFDRRGAMVFSQNDLPQDWSGWDGRLNGVLVEEGVYFYTIQCECATGETTDCPRARTGSFILVH